MSIRVWRDGDGEDIHDAWGKVISGPWCHTETTFCDIQTRAESGKRECWREEDSGDLVVLRDLLR